MFFDFQLHRPEAGDPERKCKTKQRPSREERLQNKFCGNTSLSTAMRQIITVSLFLGNFSQH